MIKMFKRICLFLFALGLATTFFTMPTSAAATDPSLKVATQTILGPTPGYNKVRYEAALLVKEALESLGVDVEVKPIDFKVLMDTIRSEPWDFDAFIKGWGATSDRIDPHNFLYNMLCSKAIRDQGINRQGYSNPEYDKVIEAAESTLDPEKRRELVYKAQEILAEDVAIFILYHDIANMPYNNERLEGVIIQGGIGINNPETYMNVKIKEGDNVLKVAQHAPNEDFNVFTTGLYSDIQVLDLIYDFLVRLDENNKPYPSVAESWEVVDDTTIKVIMKEGLKFHDGDPLTAEDVKFTFDYAMEHGIARSSAYLQDIDFVEAPDERTVVFHLKKPTGYFINGTLMVIPIVPKHVWEKIDNPHETSVMEPLGSGPFKFTYWRRGEEVRLDINKDYHRPINIDAVIFKPFQSVDSVFGAMETGMTDMYIEYLEPNQIEQAKKLDHITVASTVGISFDFFGINHRRKPWNDLAFRKAAAHVIDCDLITEVVYGEYGLPAGPGQIISPANKFWHNPNLKTYEINIEKARKILEEAGYQWDKKGKLYYPES